ncbi:MAG: cytochrome c oxidase subunit II [Thermoanaerobaculales bacterium]|jgi:cytochrome c oxidase subunit 2|nr:cytochrome c oxidase subunit II [Thermoanaerobaculales bacterium]
MTFTALGKLLDVLAGSLPDGDGSSFWLPPQVSTVARSVDWLFNFILAVSVFFFVLIVVVMVFFVIRYRRREGRKAETSPTHNLALELTWSGIPLVLVIMIFIFGFKGFLDMSTPPANAYEILVEGQKWNWSFIYPNGYIDSNLHVPVNRPVRLVMGSQDVIHSLYIPAFRVKMDVVPGRYSKAWFEATQPGEYDLFCAEYCGTSHSDMIAHVVVHPVGEFETWLEKASNFLETMAPVDAGRKLFQVRGCQQCHSVDGSAKTGPSLLGVFGRTQNFADGSSLTIDENYIRESILEPQARVVNGFDPVMPTYQGRLSDPEILALIEYFKSLDESGE